MLHSSTELVAGRAPKFGVERTQGRSDAPHPGFSGSGRIRAAWGKNGPPARGEQPTWRSRHGSIAISTGGPKQTRAMFCPRSAESYYPVWGRVRTRPRQPAGAAATGSQCGKMASADECLACLAALLEDGEVEGVAACSCLGACAESDYPVDPRSEHIFKRTDLRDSDSWFPTSLLTCCMRLRSHPFLLYSATHPSTSMLHGSHRPLLPAIFRHPPLHLPSHMLHASHFPPLSAIFRQPTPPPPCCMGLTTRRFLLYSVTHPSTSPSHKLHTAWVSGPTSSSYIPIPNPPSHMLHGSHLSRFLPCSAIRTSAHRLLNPTIV